MPRKKLQRFAQVSEHPLVLEYTDERFKDKFLSYIKEEEVILELGCGSGQYTLALAKLFPKKKFIGVDIQGERLWYGANEAQDNEIENAIFLRDYIDRLEAYVPDESISEIWVTFPDPHPKKGKAKKRLTAERFLDMYAKMLKKSGMLHLKTDNNPLFEFSLETIGAHKAFELEEQNEDVPEDTKDEILQIQTYFEQKHRKLGSNINYLRAKRK